MTAATGARETTNEPADWETTNNAYLTAGLAWTRDQLSGAASDAEASPWWEIGSEAEPPPALELLGDRLGLSRFERLVLILAAAMELDPNTPARCADASGNPHTTYPTMALALTMLPGATWDVVSPQRPLRYWRLIEFDEPRADALTATRFRIDERIVSFIKGLNVMDERLAAIVSPVPMELTPSLPPTHERAVADIIVALTEEGDEQPPAVQLVGVDASVRRYLAGTAAQRLGRDLYEITAERVPTHPQELSDLIRLWERETLLLPVLMYADTAEVSRESSIGIDALFERVRSHVLLGTREPRPLRSRRLRVIDTPRPTPAEQQALWQELLPDDTETPQRLAAEFDLSQLAITDVVRQCGQNGRGAAGLWSACRAQTRPRLDTLARRVEPSAGWDDLVLPDAELALLRHIADQVRGRATVLSSWGFGERITRGSAVTALFAGGSGTGKTLAAEVIAHELELDMYRVDLAGVVSKYIGETEQNLRRVFDAAEEGGSLLMFDEADALFGKRSEVKDSHDRYANIEVSYLLARMEDYRGIAILATNLRHALDDAFLRRLRFIVDFPFPSPTERARLWAQAFPAQAPVDELDLERLARLAASGGMIRNIAINAAFCAAGQGTRVGMELVLEMARIEFRKLERHVNDADFRIEGAPA
ncbi:MULTISPECIES: ATP-binding protein [Mycobacterium]|uniref:ATPase n=1 Tax=Mycobacterium kiyosense TaxID=2871094 RepID=A0A9P3Q8P1_9MYCO|nr:MULTISPECIES: ATP-binding protein [Mycobacterium]BDE11150.1 ATPase [Mycobacterium sp. 20KCMC460]GLB83528.1 ATPase [Mycobacterium kiyosense]GLB91401.1 ATPase [Mycobacterium kiyosense]GLB97551.1 ATPase [Mycobacterium kiyosense]GLC04347.1 ATPase [Mycobacterium kiyosense]